MFWPQATVKYSLNRVNSIGSPKNRTSLLSANVYEWGGGVVNANPGADPECQ